MRAHSSVGLQKICRTSTLKALFFPSLKTYPYKNHLRTASSTSKHYPVAVIGAGPTGLTLSCLLSQFGIKHIVLEKNAEIATHPKAHVINVRSMEILRSIDLMEKVTREATPPLKMWRKFIYCRSLTGTLLGEVDHFQGINTNIDPELSVTGVVHVPQHRFLSLLLDAAKKLAGESQSEICFSQTVEDFLDRGDDGVQLNISGRDNIIAKYVIGCDGSSSNVREQVNSKFRGTFGIQHLINIYFISDELAQQLNELNRFGMLYFVFGVETIVVLVAHDLRKGEFVAQVPYYPPIQNESDFTASVCTDILQTASGIPDLSLTIKDIRAWSMSGLVAETWREPRNMRIMLAGDAAHVFPPSGGFGMNAGIGDAHNLAWKLAFSLQNDSHISQHNTCILDSYEAERKPCAEFYRDLSIQNWHDGLRVPAALGLNVRNPDILTHALSTNPLSSVFPDVGKKILNVGLRAGLLAAASNPFLGSPAQLRHVFDQNRTLRLVYPREDLGIMYSHRQSAIIPNDEKEWKSIHKTGQVSMSLNRGIEYCANILPGSRLPHVRLRLLDVNTNTIEWEINREGRCRLRDAIGTLLSSHDLLTPYELAFILLTDQEGAIIWSRIVNDLCKSLPYKIYTAAIISFRKKL